MSQESSDGRQGPCARRPGGAAAGWGILTAGLALFGYRDLLRFDSDRNLPEELEEWFFVPSDSLAPLVLLLSAWLLYRRWDRLRALPAVGGGAGVTALLLGLGLAIYGWATFTDAPDLLLPALLCHCAAALWHWKGAPALRAACLPLVFLLLAIPIPAPALNVLLFRLQIATTEIAGFFLYLLEVPHYVAGEQILRTEHTFSVIESCSGLRSIQTLTLVSVLMVDLFRRPPVHAWLVVLAAPGVAFFLNGVRALTLILNPRSEVVAIHNLQGVAILLGGLVVLFLWDGLLERLLPHAVPQGVSAPTGDRAEAGPRRPRALVVTLSAAAALSLWLPRFEREETPPIGASARLAASLGLSEELEIDRRFLGSVGFQESFQRRFAVDDDEVFLFVGIGDRGARARSPVSPKTGIPASGWVVESEEELELEGGVRARARLMRHGSHRILVYHWYHGALGWPRESLRALLALDRSPWRRPGEILAVRLGVPIVGPVEQGRATAERKLLSFFHLLRPLLDGMEQDLSRKSFSRFSSSGKIFSSPAARMCLEETIENRYLRKSKDTAWDLLSLSTGTTINPAGVQADLQSLGWDGVGFLALRPGTKTGTWPGTAGRNHWERA